MSKNTRFLFSTLLLSVLVFALICFFSPSPSRDYIYHCAELSSSGEVIGRCELSFTAAIQEHHHQRDQFSLESIEIPGVSILDTFPTCSIWEAEGHWWVSLPAADRNTARTYTLDIAISTDGTLCLIRYSNRRFVGSTSGDFDPEQVLPIFSERLEDFFTYRDPFS